MEMQELFPSWMAHEVAFFNKHFMAITTVAQFMSNGNHWDAAVMWEKLLRNCAKAECACGEPWDRDTEEDGCWKCGRLKPGT